MNRILNNGEVAASCLRSAKVVGAPKKFPDHAARAFGKKPKTDDIPKLNLTVTMAKIKKEPSYQAVVLQMIADGKVRFG